MGRPFLPGGEGLEDGQWQGPSLNSGDLFTLVGNGDSRREEGTPAEDRDFTLPPLMDSVSCFGVTVTGGFEVRADLCRKEILIKLAGRCEEVGKENFRMG